VTPRRLLPVAVVAVAVAAAGAIVAVAAHHDRRTPTVPRRGGPVSALATLSPRVVLFGAALNADLRVTVDPKRVDPRSVQVVAHFRPFDVLGPPRRRVERGGGVTVVRYTYRIQCVASVCSAPGGQVPVLLQPARVRFGTPTAERLITWPRETVASRLTRDDVAHPAPRYAAAAAARSYRIDPSVAGWAAVGSSAVLVLVLGGAGATRLRRRRLPPAPPLSDLEVALARLEHAALDGNPAARRSAISHLAEALEGNGFPELAPLARRLAWSSGAPSAEVASELAALVHAALEVAA
jgi:hypothetical protein